MTPKEITTLAGHRLVPPWVMKLALDVAAAERELCAKVCEELSELYLERCKNFFDERYAAAEVAAIECAAAIRQRGEK